MSGARLTFKYRLKDKHAKRLTAQATAVNVVWNYCNETQQKAARAGRKWLTGYDLVRLTAGSAKAGLDVVGDASPSKIARTRFAKSVLDAGWADFKRMLSYKAIRHGGIMLEVCERYTSQTCSNCGVLPASRPKGIAGLRKRVFECDDCGAVLDRDVNAASNILRCGLASLVAGTPPIAGRNPGLQAGE